MQPNTVLLLEDDPVIALDVRLELEAQGYWVAIATDTNDAVALSRIHAFEMAILNFWYDNSLDGMDIAQLLHLNPEVRLLLITGVRSQDFYATQSPKIRLKLLHKPFTRKQLHCFLLP